MEKFNKLSEQELGVAFYNACEKGDLDEVKFILKNFNMDYKLNDGLTSAVISNKLDIVKYLLSSPDLKTHADFTGYNERLLIIASYNDNLDMIKYLTSSPDLKTYPNFQHDNNGVFKNFFYKKDKKQGFNAIWYFIFELDIYKNEDIEKILNEDHSNSNLKKFASDIQTLFNIRDLNRNLNIHNKNELLINLNKALTTAFNNEYYDQIDFLLNSPKLSLHANFDSVSYEIFETALSEPNIPTIQSLIFEYGLEKTSQINSLLDQYKNDKFVNFLDRVEQVEKMFVIKQVNDDLKSELNNNEVVINKKPKL